MAYVIPLGKRLILLNRAVVKKIDERAKKMDLTATQLRVLGEISRLTALGRQEITQRDLENSFAVAHPTMTGVIKRLEKKGFVRCTEGKNDRRYKNIFCAEEVSRIHEELARIDGEAMAELCAGLTNEEVENLYRITDKMLKNI